MQENDIIKLRIQTCVWCIDVVIVDTDYEKLLTYSKCSDNIYHFFADFSLYIWYRSPNMLCFKEHIGY